ncbi:MAG TPA: phage head-tail connector protein, partial [Gammaproteobacteria bacterium]|nr:phage head-tail connector protein [Gammaproteobacteria bacterium]
MKEITIDIDEPNAIPFDLATLKADLRIATDDLDDVLMSQYIPDAVAWAEGAMRRSVMARTHRWILECFPYGDDQTIRLPRGKVQGVTSIVY